MKNLFRITFGIAVVAVMMAVIAPAAEAQCSAGRVFASVGLAGAGEIQMIVDPNGAHNQSDQIGMFWDPGNSALGNNFGPNGAIDLPGAIVDDTCCINASTPGCDPAQGFGGWWNVQQTTLRGVQGTVTGTGCLANSCPDNQLIVVVEDWGPTGPPGVGDTAYFIAMRVDRLPGAARDWDLARVDRVPDNNQIAMQQYPRAFITSSTKVGTIRNVVIDFFDIAPNVWGVKDPGQDNNLPPEALVTDYVLYEFIGASDPGRDRSLWAPVATAPYQPGGVPGFRYDAPCDDIAQNTFLSVGVAFEGGNGPTVFSNLVGEAIEIECDPNLATPEPVIRPGARTREPNRRSGARSGR